MLKYDWIIRAIRKNRTLLLVLASLVVIVTTYMLVLPAFTLDANKAKEQGGIDVGKSTQKIEYTCDDYKVTCTLSGADAASIKEDPEVTEDPEIKSEKSDESEETDESKKSEQQTKETKSEDAGKASIDLDVKELTKKDKDYSAYVKKAEELVAKELDKDESNRKIAASSVYDISLTSNGEEKEPEKPVSVTFEYDKIQKMSGADDVRIVHFAVNNGKETAELLDPEDVSIETKKDGIKAVHFKAESFSVYAIVYTVKITENENKETNTEVHNKNTSISANDDTYEIEVTYDDEANIPENAELKVREILPGEDEYTDYYEKSLGEINVSESDLAKDFSPNHYVHVFDIEIWDGKNKVEPESEVSVNIKLLDVPEDIDKDLKVVHFSEEGPEVLNAENSSEKQSDETELRFTTDAFSVYTVVSASGENLNGQSFALVSGIANDPGATTGYGETWGRDYFTIIVNAHAVSNKVNGSGISSEGVHTWSENGVSYVGGEVPEWTFESAGNGKYYLSIIDQNGNKKYMTRNVPNDRNAGIGDLSTANRQYSQFTITDNGDGTALIYYDGGSYNQRYYLYNDGYGEWATRTFKFINNVNDLSAAAYRFKLCKRSDEFDSLAAKKVSASTITTDKNYVIYRKFIDEQSNESLYALAHDGTFVRVYDGGDTIYWRETSKNIYWKYETDGSYPTLSTTDPVTNEKIYISPNHSTGQTLSTTVGRLTLIGRDNGEYSTAIEAWDQKAYDYAGLHVTVNNEGATLSTGTRVAETSDEFLFAEASQMPGAVAETVDTVDSDSLGIKITMFDYGEAKGSYNAGDKLDGMTNVAGSADYTPHAAHALVKPYLESGIPSSVSKGAMTGLFTSGGSEVTAYRENINHLFIQSYYDESGTFRYRSEDNYAYLPFDAETGTITGDNFTVYRQAASPYTDNISVGHTYYHHGHFMPYNDIDMSKNISRLMNQYGNAYENGSIIGEIPIGDGRTYDDVYGVQGIPNFYTGMEMEANFTQPRNGKLDNGDDMVFKFTGDDDMWVYIDGVLVLDIGGIHEPLSGTIDFATGTVSNPTGSSLAGSKTLYQIFMAVLNDSSTPSDIKDKIRDITWKDVDGNGTPDTFADYTNHSFKAFYMERGAGASNLDIQFNLKVVLTDQFVVEKELPEDIDDRFVNQTYKFQATYKDATDNNTEKPLYAGTRNKNNEVVCNSVVYRDKKDALGNPVNVPVDENGYFYLKAGEAAIFKMKDDSIQYNVKELELDKYNLEKIKINGDEVTDHVEINDQQATISDNSAVAGYDEVRDRSNVLYTNYPKKQNLLITKHLTKDSAPLEEDENPVFEFRVYLESTVEVTDTTQNPPVTTTTHKLIPYSYGPYYLIKEINGVTHYFTLTGVNNAPVDKGTEKVFCSTTGRSGSINSIPPEYTIVIPDLTIGTNFYLEERRDNIPEGYEFVREVLTEETYDASDLDTSTEAAIHRVIARDETDHQEFDPSTIGRIKDDVDAESHVYNRKPAVNITVEKKWEPEPDPNSSTTVTVELHRYAKKTKGTISVTLYDNNDAPIEGAKFELYKDGNPTDIEVTTDVNGNAGISKLEPGTYKLVQKSTPLNYSMDGHKTETGELTVVDNVTTPQVLSERLTNTALVTAGKVVLTVTDSGAGSGTEGSPVVGATFELYKDGSVYNTGYTTTDEGKIVVGSLPAGNYYFVQTGVPEQYKMPETVQTESFTVLEQPGVTQQFYSSMSNSLKGKGTVTLTLKKDTGETVSEAAFQLKSGDTIIETGSTGNDGTLSFSTELYEGSYTVHQVDTGSAGSDYAVASDQIVSVDANSVTNQQKNLTFTNEEAAGNVTIKLWAKGQTGQWNWNIKNTYNELKAGQEYTFIATLKSGLYPNNVWFYSDDRDHENSDSIAEASLSNLDASCMSNNNTTYTFKFTPEQNDKVYSLVLVSGWGMNDIYTMEMVTNSSNTRTLSLQARSSNYVRKTSSMPIKTATGIRSITHTDATPAQAPDGYATDSTFVVEYTLTSADNWRHTFDTQDKYDANGDPYYYYIVETNCSDPDYWIDSYSGDYLNEAGTITVTNKKEETSSITLKKVDEEDLNKTNPTLLKGASFTLSKYLADDFKDKDTSWGNAGSISLNDSKNLDGTYSLNGVFTFNGIKSGYYQIQETNCPAGYVRLVNNPTFKVERGVSNQTVITLINNPGNLLRVVNGELVIVVGNTPGVELPSAGGPGTHWIYLIGMLLAVGCSVMLVARRRAR